jgi:thiamine-phosphate diphosphorylase
MTSLRRFAASGGQASMLVTDRRRFGLSAAALVDRAARADVDLIQVREPDLSDADLLALVRAMIRATAPLRTKVLVNDRPDVAVAAGAAGVHLRSDSASAARVRTMVPAGFVLGRSVHSLRDVDAALAGGGYDYLLFGTVFPSAGKPPDHPVAGLDGLAAACSRSPIPVIAIGGIDAARLADIATAGAAGFAGIGMFM